MGYINKHISQFGVLMVYATLGEYFQTLYPEHEPVQVRDHHDFLPYSSGMSLWGLRWRFGARDLKCLQTQCLLSPELGAY